MAPYKPVTARQRARAFPGGPGVGPDGLHFNKVRQQEKLVNPWNLRLAAASNQ
jgi:hypothetical protein